MHVGKKMSKERNMGETVTRYFDYMAGHLKEKHNYTMPDSLRAELEEAVLNTGCHA